jgi:hypothetical protein
MHGSFALCLTVNDGIAQNAIRPHALAHGNCETQARLEEPKSAGDRSVRFVQLTSMLTMVVPQAGLCSPKWSI